MITKHVLIAGMIIAVAMATVFLAYGSSNASAAAVYPAANDRPTTLGTAAPVPIFDTSQAIGITGDSFKMAASSGGRTKSGTRSGGGTSQGGSNPPMRPGDYPLPSGGTATAATAAPTGSKNPTGLTGGSGFPE